VLRTSTRVPLETLKCCIENRTTPQPGLSLSIKRAPRSELVLKSQNNKSEPAKAGFGPQESPVSFGCSVVYLLSHVELDDLIFLPPLA
jgi:hypothetical protein